MWRRLNPQHFADSVENVDSVVLCLGVEVNVVAGFQDVAFAVEIETDFAGNDVAKNLTKTIREIAFNSGCFSKPQQIGVHLFVDVLMGKEVD